MKFGDLFAPVPLGIAAGLFIGKQIGIFGATWLAVRSGLASMPTGATWRQIYGVALLGGIGFTMSLFIGTLAFPDGGAGGACAARRAGRLHPIGDSRLCRFVDRARWRRLIHPGDSRPEGLIVSR